MASAMLEYQSDPIVSVATAPGRGAVGIVRVSGKNIRPLVSVLCRCVPEPRKATFLTFKTKDGDPIDQGLAIFFPAPNSYTGEDVLELQVHGGPVVMQLLLRRCLEAAAEKETGTEEEILPYLRLAKPGEFTERAYLNGKIDLAQAEAIADLIDAGTEAAARGASRSVVGAFSSEIHAVRDRLIHLRMLVEATLDFPEEEIDFLKQADAQGQLNEIKNKLSSVLTHAKQGALLSEGIKVVIAGQPNAGKSSLLNALAGMELAIVTAIPGTTRDKVQQTIQIEGVPLHIIDTAGLRQSDDEVEKIGISRSWDEISQADIVLFLHDMTRADQADYLDADKNIEKMIRSRVRAETPLLDLWNKSDAADMGCQGGLALSAKTGEGLQALRHKLLEYAGWQPGGEGVYIARARHVQALQRVSMHLTQAMAQMTERAPKLELLAEELRLGQNALGEITGEFSNEEMLGLIFSKFCIGK